MYKYSIIIPVYNRPNEIKELLDSLLQISYNNYEVIIVEDGSEKKSEDICKEYKDKLNLTYYYQENTGPGPARNTGAALAKGEYLIFFDSDIIVPEKYFEILNKEVNNIDSFGGPDMAHESFSPIQKAISYSMTSKITTGGIRGGKKQLDKFYPRSFNLGVKREVFNDIKGYSKMRFGEDLDFSMRLLEKGYSSKLIIDAAVYHKRRNTFRSFYKQVYNSGIARINLYYRHPKSLKLVHVAPSLFVIGNVLLLISGIIYFPLLLLIFIAPLTFFIHALFSTRNLKVAFLSMIASMVQLFGYGLGFLSATIKRIIFKNKEFDAFNKTFYD